MKSSGNVDRYHYKFTTFFLRALAALGLSLCANAGLAQTAAPDSVVQITAESQGLQLVSTNQLPQFGTYWLASQGGPNGIIAAPLPTPTFDPTMPVYQITWDEFLVDETGGQVLPPQLAATASSAMVAAAVQLEANTISNLIDQVQAAEAFGPMSTTMAAGSMRMTTMDSSGPPLPGGSGGTPSGFPSYSINSNLLWLQITNVLSGTAYANLYNATDQVYAIWSTTNLTVPFSLWSVETEVFPTNGTTNNLPFIVPTLGRQDLFLRAQDWTGVFTNGLPDWWTWYYFHTLDLSWTDIDSGGNTLGYDYTNHLDPDVIVFSIVPTNSYVNTASPNLLLNIVSGMPGYSAVLVNDTNLADARWLLYTNSTVVAPLGTDGDYNVSVGLRGFPTNATATWQTVALIKNTVFPQLTITNPASGTLSQSSFQFQGYASEPLDSLIYDLSNASGTLTNQQAYLTGVYWNQSTGAMTTNYFQSDNIDLTSGANVITLHATDWAGNNTTTNFTVNFTPSTNPPVLSLIYPTAGTPILAGNFTLQAQVSDATAAVTATINGVTTPALVDGYGFVWVQNLALNPGTNTVTLSANTALGGTTTTNFPVVSVTNNMGLTVDPLFDTQPNQGSITVSGTISDLSTYCVYVNGVKATSALLGDNTDWVADSVPVNPYGMAALNIQVYTGDPVLVGTTNIIYAQPLTVALASYSGHQMIDSEQDNINWSYNVGGTLNDSANGQFNITPTTNGEAYYDFGLFNPFWEFANLSVSITNSIAHYESHTQTRVMIEPGGAAQAGTTNFYLVFADADEFSDADINQGPPGVNQNSGYGMNYLTLIMGPTLIYYTGDVPLPPGWLQINRQTLSETGVTNFDANGDITSIWGATILSAPAGQTLDVTPVATKVYTNWDYTFDVQAYPLHMQILDANGNDLTLQTNTVIVGQQMNLTCQISFTNSFYTNTFVATNFQWTVPGYAISNYVVASDTNSAFVVTNFPLNSSNVVFYWVDGASNRVVQCCATVNGATIIGQATLNVVRPSIDFLGTTNAVVSLDNNFASFPTNYTYLHFGGSVSNGIKIPGIQFLCTNADVYGYSSGLFVFTSTQMILNDSTTRYKSNGSITNETMSGLDNTYPYEVLGDGNGSKTEDGPGFNLFTNDVQVVTTQSFRMTLLFQPDEPSIPIPIKEIDWQWTGRAITNGAGWMLVQPGSVGVITVNNQNTVTYPTWTNAVANQE